MLRWGKVVAQTVAFRGGREAAAPVLSFVGTRQNTQGNEAPYHVSLLSRAILLHHLSRATFRAPAVDGHVRFRRTHTYELGTM